MNRIKTYSEYCQLTESVNNDEKLAIPDDLAIWCMDFYSEQTMNTYNFTKIPQVLINSTKNFVKSKGGIIYRGFGLEEEFKFNKLTFKPKFGLSWSFDEDISIGFADGAHHEGRTPYLAKINIDKLKYVLSVDLIMDNITEEQLKMVTNPMSKVYMKDYKTEFEVLVFDTFTLTKNNITKLNVVFTSKNNYILEK